MGQPDGPLVCLSPQILQIILGTIQHRRIAHLFCFFFEDLIHVVEILQTDFIILEVHEVLPVKNHRQFQTGIAQFTHDLPEHGTHFLGALVVTVIVDAQRHADTLCLGQIVLERKYLVHSGNEYAYHDFSLALDNGQTLSISYYDTPTILYIMYVNDKPVGYIGLRTKINDEWKEWSGNFFYTVRLSERKKGYCTKMLELALDEFKKLGLKEIYGNSSSGNIGSEKVIQNNGGILIREDEYGRKFYKIIL